MFLKHWNNVSEEESSNSTTNIILKVVSIVVFLVMAVIFGVMPHFIEKCRKSTTFLSVSNAFAGGLFLGIGLFHVLPESNEMLEDLTDAPLAFFCAFLSYALILFVEKVSFNSHSLLHDHDHLHIHLHKEEKEEKDEKEAPMVKVDMKPKDEEHENEHENNDADHHEHEHEHEEHTHKGSSITPYILLLALGFHGLFEGMALGIQSSVQSTLSLFLAIAAHKWAASLTLGISFVKAGIMRRQLIIMVLIFAFIGPVGVAIGLILSSTANEIVQGIFLAISVGTFIYIACTEVLVEEFENPNHKYLKFLMFMLGGIFIGGLSLLEMVLDIEE